MACTSGSSVSLRKAVSYLGWTFIFIDPELSAETRDSYICTTDTNTKSFLPSYHLNLTLTSPPLTAASSMQDLHLPHGLSCLILSVIAFSFPLIFPPSPQQSRADLSDQHSQPPLLLPSSNAHTQPTRTLTSPSPAPFSLPICLSHTC